MGFIKKNVTTTVKRSKPTKMNMDEYLAQEANTILENFTCAYVSHIDNCKKRSYVADSHIHGKGLFAACNIRQGEIITYFPAHYVITKPNGYNSVDGEFVKNVVSSLFVDGKPHSKDHVFVIDEYISICGDPDIIDNSDFLAHMANDAMIVKSKSFGEKQNEIYETLSRVKNNSIVELSDSSCIFLRATKDIEKDEEITNPYGYNYWVKENLRIYL